MALNLDPDLPRDLSRSDHHHAGKVALHESHETAGHESKSAQTREAPSSKSAVNGSIGR